MSMRHFKLTLSFIGILICFHSHSDELWKHVLVSDYIIFGTLNSIAGDSSENKQRIYEKKHKVTDFSYIQTDQRLPPLGDVVEVVLSRGNSPETVINLVGKKVVIFGVRAASGSETNALYTRHWPLSDNVRPNSEILRLDIEKQLDEIDRYQAYSARLSCHNDAAKLAVEEYISALKKSGGISSDYMRVLTLGKDVIPYLIYQVNNSDPIPSKISFPAFNRDEAYRIYSPMVVGNAINLILQDITGFYFKPNHNGGTEISRTQATKAWNYFLYKTSSEYSYCSLEQ